MPAKSSFEVRIKLFHKADFPLIFNFNIIAIFQKSSRNCSKNWYMFTRLFIYIYNLSIYVYIYLYLYLSTFISRYMYIYIHKYRYTHYKSEYTYTNICYTNIYLNLYFPLNKFTVSYTHHAPVLLNNLILPKYIFLHNPRKPIMLGNKN